MLLEEEADAGQDTLEVAHSWGESSMKSSKTQDWRIPMEKGEVFHSNEHLPSYYTASYSSPCLRLLLSTYMVSSRKVETAYTHYHHHHRTSVLTKKKIHEKKASLLSVITFVWKNIAWREMTKTILVFFLLSLLCELSESRH